MKSYNTSSIPSTVPSSPVKFDTYAETHTYAQIKEEVKSRTSSQQDILNVVDDVTSKNHIPPDLITDLYKRLKSPSDGELVGNLNIDHILLSGTDPAVLLLLFENFIPLLDGYSDEETKEILRDYFFQLIDQTRAFLKSYDEVYPTRSSLIPLDVSTNISAAALLLQAGSTCYDFYTFNSNLKNRNTGQQKSSKSSKLSTELTHPHLYFSELVSFDSVDVPTSQQKARKRILNLFLSLSSVRKKGITPCQELEPYIASNICRLDKNSNKLYSLKPTGYLLEVNSHQTIKKRINLRNAPLVTKAETIFFRHDQLNDIVSKIIDPESVINTSIKSEINYQLTFNDLTKDRLEHYKNSTEWWSKTLNQLVIPRRVNPYLYKKCFRHDLNRLSFILGTPNNFLRRTKNFVRFL